MRAEPDERRDGDRQPRPQLRGRAPPRVGSPARQPPLELDVRRQVHAGRIQIGEMEIDAPKHVQEGPAIAYVRPYDLELDRIRGNGGSIEAIIRDIHAVGALVRLDLERSDSQGMIEAELTRDRYNELELQEGERVFVRPRNLRVF
jgi:sulfate transport system ATP-binding protein